MNFIYDGEELKVKFSTYYADGGLAVNIDTAKDRPFATLSACIVGTKLAPDEFCVKTWAENASLIPFVKDLFIDTGRTIQTGHVTAPIWRIKHKPKTLVIDCNLDAVGYNECPVVIFDNDEQAQEWVNRQPVRKNYKYRFSLVEYRP